MIWDIGNVGKDLLILNFAKTRVYFGDASLHQLYLSPASYCCEKENINIFYKKMMLLVNFPKWEGFKSCNCLSKQQVNHVQIIFSQLMIY